MDINSIFTKRKQRWNLLQTARKTGPIVWVTCDNCQAQKPQHEIEAHLWICPECGHYLTMKPADRIRLIADKDTFTELNKELKTKDPIHFPGYRKKVEACIRETGNRDAIVTGVCQIDGIKTALGVMDASFLMGSMGTVVGEKIARLAEYAGRKKLPLIIYSASGGARMQEGLFSLLQMAKTAGAVRHFQENGGLFISVMTNPTTGGVSASFASIGDIMIAEPDARICFAGPRVIEQTIGEKLPEGFQKSEFLLAHGMLDLILERREQKEVIARLLRIHNS